MRIQQTSIKHEFGRNNLFVASKPRVTFDE